MIPYFCFQFVSVKFCSVWNCCACIYGHWTPRCGQLWKITSGCWNSGEEHLVPFHSCFLVIMNLLTYIYGEIVDLSLVAVLGCPMLAWVCHCTSEVGWRLDGTFSLPRRMFFKKAWSWINILYSLSCILVQLHAVPEGWNVQLWHSFLHLTVELTLEEIKTKSYRDLETVLYSSGWVKRHLLSQHVNPRCCCTTMLYDTFSSSFGSVPRNQCNP